MSRVFFPPSTTPAAAGASGRGARAPRALAGVGVLIAVLAVGGVLAARPSLAATAAAEPVATAPTDADGLVGAAAARAAKSDKNVLVIFHASWCRWCRRLERFTREPAVAAVLAANYEIVWVDALERGPAKSLETPGGTALLKKLGGGDGLPYLVVLAANGTKRADSGEIGYPVKDDEVAAFMAMIHDTAPHASAADLATLRTQLVAR